MPLGEGSVCGGFVALGGGVCLRWTRCPWGKGSVCGGFVALGGRGLFAVDLLPLGEGSVAVDSLPGRWCLFCLRTTRRVVSSALSTGWSAVTACVYKKKQVSWPCQPLHFCSHSIVCSLAHGGSLFTVAGTKRVPAEWRRRRDCSETGVSGCRHEGRNRCVVAQSRGERGR